VFASGGCGNVRTVCGSAGLQGEATDMADLSKIGPGGLNLLTALQAAERLEAGTATSVALVEDCLARIAARDGLLHSWTWLDRDGALRQARARDSEPRRSPLHGIPVGIKDIFDTHDMPTEYGSPIHAGHRPANDSVVVGLMRRAGMVILGKCATTEFASPVLKEVRNPHDPARSPGVSSSGSAAAVADFMVPLAVGSQTGGSTILPAAYCGIVGYKASLSGLDRGNIRHLRPTLDTIGLFARSIADIACLRALLCGTAEPLPHADAGKLRIGVCRTASYDQAQPETVTAIENAAKALAKAGASVRDVALPSVFEGIEETFGVISSVEAGRAMAYEAREHRGRLNQWIRDSLDAAARHDQARYDRAQCHVIDCQRALAAIFERCDVLITPSTNGEAPEVRVAAQASVFNRTWTLMHVPCLTIPAYHGPHGMPVGIQVVGPVGGDVRTIAAAQAIAQALD
jgi:Asp-tRNA(Asn)/Glu-tRNA(Gln) amidotransferase A subunit family amidase